MKKTIALVRGDGIGPEIVDSAVTVLTRVAPYFKYVDVCAGGASIDKYGKPLSDCEFKKCADADAILLGAVGGPKWDGLTGNMRPERALLAIRAGLGLYANLRPTHLFRALMSACPLRTDIAQKGIDILIVRELTGGIYFGEHGRRDDSAFDVMEYSMPEISRIGRVAFNAARARSGRLVSVDKANVLETSRLWRAVMHELAHEYTDVFYSDMLVDNCAMQLVRDPSQFDVIVTENMFGDILSDEAAMTCGSIGLLPSASLGDGKLGMYEPIHGSAPDIAGKGIANPVAAILSAAMLLRHSMGMEDKARVIEDAVERVLSDGSRTADISADDEVTLTTTEMLNKILDKIGTV